MPFRLVSLTAALSLTGCMTVYQPLMGLQRPVAIDPQLANFERMRMVVRCIPGDDFDAQDAQRLCRNMRTLFSNQGADVETQVPRAGGDELEDLNPKKPDFVIDMRSRLIHEENSGLLWLLCIASATLIPAITESTFAQDVTIKDGNGFTLINGTYQSRFVRYFGIATWGINGLLDLLIRSPSEKLTTDGAERDFSRDFYRQMSQLAFHAQMRRRVLRSFEPEPGPPVSPGAR